MEELVIEGKTYISSKRAASITGYAKDYVGQLCREGRVEARLVGRSWYVFEPSITKHRFEASGESSSEPVEERQKETEENQQEGEETKEEIDASWDKPRYEAETVEEIENAWREWFSSPHSSQESVSQEKTEEKQLEEETHKKTEQIPITILRDETKIEIPTVKQEQKSTKLQQNRSFKHQIRNSTQRLWKAASIAVILIVLAITMLGLGFGDSLGGILKNEIGFIKYFEGVTEVIIISK